MKKRNPKQVGTILYDCVPQKGPCPNKCNQCYYNECFYAGHEPLIPEPRDVVGGIVRMNSGNDSNNDRKLVLKTAAQYKNVFFNTSLADLNFPGPVVLTANKCEENTADWLLPDEGLHNVMFVRFRTSATNLDNVLSYASSWARQGISVVLTLMRYRTVEDVPENCDASYENELHITNNWWVPTQGFWRTVVSRSKFQNNRLIHTCGSYKSHLCKDCHLCESYYRITKKRMIENGYYK